MIELESVSKHFGKLRALDDVSVTFEEGRSYALIGPNGSGKTTMIKSILGMVVPSAGQIRVNGKSIRNDWKYRANIGYMPQIGRYPDNMRIGQLIDMIKNLRNTAATDEELIEAFDLKR